MLVIKLDFSQHMVIEDDFQTAFLLICPALCKRRMKDSHTSAPLAAIGVIYMEVVRSGSKYRRP